VEYKEDFILNLANILGIWDGNNQIFPEMTEKLSFWDYVRRGVIPLNISIPIWVFYIIVSIGALLYFRYFIYEAGKRLIKATISTTNTLDPTGQYSIVDEIKLPEDTQGIIAIRDWNIKRHNFLMSANQGLLWDNRIMKADEKPIANNNKGLYAYRLGTNIQRSWGKVSGIVSLTGRCVGHANGLIRAERCRILLLLCWWPYTAKELSSRYGVPVMLVFDKRRALEQWLVSSEGIHWLKQNANIINQEITLSQEIEEILKKEDF